MFNSHFSFRIQLKCYFPIPTASSNFPFFEISVAKSGSLLFCFLFFSLHFLLHSVVTFESVCFLLHCGPQKENNTWDVWCFTLTLMPYKIKLFSRKSKGGRGIHQLHEWMSWRVNTVSFCKHFRVVYISTKLYHLQEWKTSDFFLLHCTFLAVFLFFYSGWV